MARQKECRLASCHELVSFSSSNPYCIKHASLYKKQDNKELVNRKSYNKVYNAIKRDKEANAFYHTKSWEHLSSSIRRRGMFTCECCGRTYDRKGYLVVDHIVPRRINKSLQLEPSNLWILCKKCHWYKGLLETKIYHCDLFVDNLDASKKWNKEKCREWILSKRAGAMSDSKKSSPNESV